MRLFPILTAGLIFASSFCSIIDTFASEPSASYASQLPPYQTRSIDDEIFYFVLPDRFYNGDKSNDLGSKKHAISHGGFNPTKAGSYHGGDLKGLQQKLPYLAKMGVSSIWLTPILRNQAVQGDISGYHGYWVLDFTEIDPHLGSNQDLKNLINAAHQLNIKVFFDIIANHTADVIKYKECHGEKGDKWSEQGQLCPYKTLAQKAKGDTYSAFVPKGQEQIKTPAWLNDPKYYHNQGDSTFQGENSVYGDFFGLDDLDTDNPEVVSGMTTIFKNIISQFRPDGFRIDTVKHVNIEFWQAFVPALLKHAKRIGIENFFMFGEVYSADSKVLSRYTNQGKLPSVLDFGFQQAVQNAIVDQQGTDKLAQLYAHDTDYQNPNYSANELLNFIGNHDMGRFGYFLQQSPFHYSPKQQLKRSILAHALMYFSRGIPVVYYGDEQGFVGDGGNHDSRQDMMPSKVASYNDDNLIGSSKTVADDNFDEHHPIYQALQQFARLYLQYPALRNGKQTVLFSDTKPGLLIISRQNDKQKLTLVFNTSEQSETIPQQFIKNKTTVFNLNASKSKTQIAPLSFQIYL